MRCAESGPTGRYSISGLPTGAYTIEFNAKETGGWFTQFYNGKSKAGEADPVNLTDGAATGEINAALARGTISGHVTDAITGKPVSGAEVCSTPAFSGFFAPCTTTDSEGYYQISGLALGDYYVRFVDGGYAAQYYPEQPAEGSAHEVAISPVGSATGVDAELTNIPVATGPPAIQGPAREGEPLTLTHGEWSNSPTTYTDRWERCEATEANCKAIAGAESDTYRPSPADIGSTLRVQETASNAAGTGAAATSGATAVVQAAAPVAQGAPTLTGRPQQDRALLAGTGSWTNEPTEFAYQWLRCEPGAQCEEIQGATQAEYTPGENDVGSRLEVQVTATANGLASQPDLSEESAVVLPPPPAETGPPAIVGTPHISETLTETHGSWKGAPDAYEYHWFECDNLGQSRMPLNDEGRSLYLSRALMGYRIEVQETAINAGGASEPASSEATSAVLGDPPVNVTPPSIAGTVSLNQPLSLHRGSWSAPPTSFEQQWLRCDAAGEDCQPIEGATSVTYVPTSADLGRTLAVSETATDEGGHSQPASSESTSIVEQAPLIASAGENVSVVAGSPVRLDASGSSPSGEIDSYAWELGDGTSASGSVVSHSYAIPGSFEATVTVKRGSETAQQHVTVTVLPVSAADVRIHVLDSEGHVIAGASAIYLGSAGSRSEAITDGSGTAALAGLPEGTQSVYVWAAGFQPATATVDVGAAGGEATATLQSGPVATSTLKSHEMDLQEIEAAGIDTSDEANQRVFEFEIRLVFEEPGEPQTRTIDCYVNSEGQFVNSCAPVGGGECTSGECYWGGGGGGGGEGGAGGGGGGGVVAVQTVVEGHPLIQWLILKGKATILKQFFSVSMVTQNLSPDAFVLAHGQATLTLPAGLSLAPTPTPQSLVQSVPDIPGMSSATSEWIVRGDETGAYYLSAGYTGTLEPFHAPVETEAVLAHPLTVWGVNALALSVKADDTALQAGVPYHVTVGITNKAEVPLYNVQLGIDEAVHSRFIFQPDQRFTNEIPELKPGQTLLSGQYILVPDAASVGKFNPKLSSATFVGQQVHAGEGIEAVAPPPLYTLSAPTDTPYMVHLHWQQVPGAEGYEVFPTSTLDTPFAESPEGVLTSAGGLETMQALPAGATDALIPGDPDAAPKYYAVSAIIGGQPTLEFPVIQASAGAAPSGGVAGSTTSSTPGSEEGAGAPVPSCALHSVTLPGGITVEASCFTKKSSGVFTATGKLRVNGIDIAAAGQVTLNTNALELSSAGSVEVHAGAVLLYRGKLSWQFTASLTVGVPGDATIKGLPLSGDVTISLTSGGAQVTANATIQSADFKVTGKVTLQLQLASGLKLKGLTIELASNLPIKGVVVKTAKLSYRDTSAGDVWEGAIEVELPAKLPTVKGTLIVTNGHISEVEVTVSKLNKYIAYGIFLQELGLKVVVKPTSITGLIGLWRAPRSTDTRQRASRARWRRASVTPSRSKPRDGSHWSMRRWRAAGSERPSRAASPSAGK